MHGALSRRHRRDERGAVAVITALMVTGLLVAVAMALDFGLVRTDRQVNKSAADAAALAGVQSLSTSGNENYPFRGVCTALRFLRENAPRFGSISSTTGTWADGLGSTRANGCTDTSPTGVRSQLCVANTPSSWARFSWTGTWADRPVQVTIQSGYKLTTDAASWSEESLPAVAADNADASQGCDQLAVIIKQNRKPGLGAVARSADLVTTIRSVARTRSGPGKSAPAMLLLKQTGCPVLSTGASGGSSFVHVRGAVSSSGATQAGTIHSDSSGSGCSGNIFWGRAPDGIVAYAAPMSLTNPNADPAKPGTVTSVASANGITGSTVSDGLSNVYGSPQATEAAAAASTKLLPTGRSLVTRSPIDERYLSGVTAAVTAAQTSVFATMSTTAPAGWTVVNDCNPSGTIAAAKLYINCTDNNGYKGTALINSTSVVFNGKVNPSASLSMPNADHVYIFGSSADAVSIGNGATLSMHTQGNTTSTGTCKITNTNSKAVLFVKNGAFKQTGGTLRLCNTTVMMLGGRPDGCLPSVWGNPPTQTPCGGLGTGQIAQNNGVIDWTAPNERDLMTLPSGDPDPTYAPLWSDVNGLEDLALWSESAGSGFTMGGTGDFHVQGVYMVPNADSIGIGGGSAQTLLNAQYIASSITLNGNGTKLTMSVDPNAAVTLPQKKLVGLVR